MRSADRAPSRAAASLEGILERLVPPGERLLVGLSGGADSVALALLAGRARPGLVSTLHVLHGLRPDQERDAERARAAAGCLGLPCEVVEAGPRGGDAGRGETAARRRRLDALEHHAAARGIPWVLLGHHADDDRETALLQLLRGHRGLRALAGIPTLRPGRHPGVHLLRPFLGRPGAPGHADLERVCREAGLTWAEDPTNRDLRVPRNAVRAELARGRPPLDPASLDGAMARARRGLRDEVAGAAGALLDHGRVEGHGVFLAWEALQPSRRAATVEVLRLALLSLATPHRAVVRGRVLAELARRRELGRGAWHLPALPAEVPVVVGRRGLHLPTSPPAAPSWETAVLQGLLRLPLHL